MATLRAAWLLLSLLALVACEHRVNPIPSPSRDLSEPTRPVAPVITLPAPVASTPSAPVAHSIHYEVTGPTDEDPDGEKAGVFAVRGGVSFKISQRWPNVHCLSVVEENDFDGDGQTDALIESSACSSYIQPTYFFVAGTLSDDFAAHELGIGDNLKVESWNGRRTAVLEWSNLGRNLDRPETVTQRFVFEHGHAVKVDELRTVELVALANLRAEDFSNAKPGQEKTLSFDLNDDGKKDTIAGTLWERWGTIKWQVRLSDGSVSDDGNGRGCRRLGVLADRTKGHRDLVCDFDTRIRWNGEHYVYGSAE
jgi:hypothetical protein